ncbi:DUF58 domain-containing protein [Vibrio sp. 10N.222.51.C12]|uniref:DUF58 domain-containing protein n=1 Tax=Vibrio sp. 10N.222.51.C12 TaxID=3229622 RepID=UPI003551A4EE
MFDSRVAVQFERLMAMRHGHRAELTSSRSRKINQLIGKYSSSKKGRGLDFSEFRQYQLGDDIRSLDWRVTQRTGVPYVRLFSEEKERPVVICVDQRKTMFFSTVDTMKSVVAAEVFSCLSWQTIRNSDRIGAVILNDSSCACFKPRNSVAHLSRIFKTLVDCNQSLLNQEGKGATLDSASTFNDALNTLHKQGLKGASLILISDFSDLDDTTLRFLSLLQRHNDVSAISIQDSFEQPVHFTDQIYLSDGYQQVSVDENFNAQLEGLNRRLVSSQAKLKQRLQSQSIVLDTSGSHLKQLTTQLSGGRCVSK